MKIKTLPEPWSPREKFRDPAKDQWLNHTLTSGASESKTAKDNEEQLEDCKVGVRRVARAELRTEQKLVCGELPVHQTAVLLLHQPTKVSRTTSMMEPALIEPTKVSMCPKQVHQSQNMHGFLSQDLWDTSEYHN